MYNAQGFGTGEEKVPLRIEKVIKQNRKSTE